MTYVVLTVLENPNPIKYVCHQITKSPKYTKGYCVVLCLPCRQTGFGVPARPVRRVGGKIS
jgi:hypothetical protein